MFQRIYLISGIISGVVFYCQFGDIRLINSCINCISCRSIVFFHFLGAEFDSSFISLVVCHFNWINCKLIGYFVCLLRVFFDWNAGEFFMHFKWSTVTWPAIFAMINDHLTHALPSTTLFWKQYTKHAALRKRLQCNMEAQCDVTKQKRNKAL